MVLRVMMFSFSGVSKAPEASPVVPRPRNCFSERDIRPPADANVNQRQGHQRQALVLEAGDDLPGQIAGEGIRLDEDERALHGRRVSEWVGAGSGTGSEARSEEHTSELQS